MSKVMLVRPKYLIFKINFHYRPLPVGVILSGKNTCSRMRFPINTNFYYRLPNKLNTTIRIIIS